MRSIKKVPMIKQTKSPGKNQIKSYQKNNENNPQSRHHHKLNQEKKFPYSIINPQTDVKYARHQNLYKYKKQQQRMQNQVILRNSRSIDQYQPNMKQHPVIQKDEKVSLKNIKQMVRIRSVQNYQITQLQLNYKRLQSDYKILQKHLDIKQQFIQSLRKQNQKLCNKRPQTCIYQYQHDMVSYYIHKINLLKKQNNLLRRGLSRHQNKQKTKTDTRKIDISVQTDYLDDKLSVFQPRKDKNLKCLQKSKNQKQIIRHEQNYDFQPNIMNRGSTKEISIKEQIKVEPSLSKSNLIIFSNIYHEDIRPQLKNTRSSPTLKIAKHDDWQQSKDKVDRQMIYFSGEVLAEVQEFKQFLTSIIQSSTKKQILRTKLLYTFNINVKNNIHSFVDGYDDIVLLCKTSADYHFGCYSEAAFNKSSNETGQALMFSLTNRKYFKLKTGKKALSYDECYLIFGNSQIRVKACEDTIFSNFGANNSYFDSQGYTINTIFGQGKQKEVKFSCMQIYQLIFKQSI